MRIPGETNWFHNRRAAWLVLVVAFALLPRAAEAGCSDHARVFVGDVFGVQSLDIGREPLPKTPASPCFGLQCSRMPAFPVSASLPMGPVLESWAYVAQGIVTGPPTPSYRLALASAVRPIRIEPNLFRPPR